MQTERMEKYEKTGCSGVFRTLLNIYNELFLQKYNNPSY